MHIDFTKPTILTLQQYGTKVTIELDHSDTDIRELFDAFKSALIGQGYLMDTIESYVTDWAEEIKESDKDTIEKYLDIQLRDTDFSEEKPHWDWDDSTEGDDLVWGSEEEDGIATDEDIEECEYNELSEINDELDIQHKDYKGIYVQKPYTEEDEKRMDIIGQNGNEGLHYDTDNFEDYQFGDEDVDWTWDEPNEKLKEAGEEYKKKVNPKQKGRKGYTESEGKFIKTRKTKSK